jgi:hypothetical protein
MTLKDLILKYEFDTIVPDLLTVDQPIKDNLYAFKEAFDTLRRMAPGDAGGEQIVVSLEVETEKDGTEVERYLHASNCEGDLWDSSLAKDVVIEADITEIRALAQILWHITFFGFTPEHEGYRRHENKNEYERKASLLRYHQFCNYARIKPKKNPTDWELRCSLSLDDWDIYHAREAHRNRAKRMRDARQDRQIAKYERMGKIQRLIDSIVATSWDSDYADYKYLFDTKELRVFEFYSRTTSKESRAQYIVDNFVKYFNEDLTQYKRTDMVISSGEERGVTFHELEALSDAIFPRVGEVNSEEPGFIVHFATDSALGDDLYVRLICSR